jgi:TPP-dependent 2-oxoacid decarboxylase
MLNRHTGREKSDKKRMSRNFDFPNYSKDQKSSNTSFNIVEKATRSTEAIKEVVKKRVKTKRRPQIEHPNSFIDKTVPKKTDYLKEQRVIRNRRESSGRNKKSLYSNLRELTTDAEEKIRIMEEETKRMEEKSKY